MRSHLRAEEGADAGGDRHRDAPQKVTRIAACQQVCAADPGARCSPAPRETAATLPRPISLTSPAGVTSATPAARPRRRRRTRPTPAPPGSGAPRSLGQPSSSRAWAPSASLRHQLLGTWVASAGSRPRFDVDSASSLSSPPDRRAARCRSRASSARLGIGLRADRDIFAGGHRHGAGNEPGNRRRSGWRSCAPWRAGDADDQARGREDAVIGAQNRRPQPAEMLGRMALRMPRKTSHFFSLP